MAATDLERLVVQLEAQSQKLDNEISKAAAQVDKRLASIEKRVDLMRTRVESSFAAAGANAVKKFTNALLATGALVAIERFAAGIVNLAEGIKHTSDTTGISTDNLQAWAIAARRAGVDAETFNAGIEQFTNNFGKAKEGNKQLQAEFKRMGINLRGDVNQALLQLSDRLHNTQDQASRVAVVTALFGRGLKNLTPFISQGSVALQQWVRDLKAQGLILGEDVFPKIDEMKNKWEDLKKKLEVAVAPALISFFDDLGKLIDKISAPDFQQGLAAFAKTMAQVASAIASIPPQYWAAILGAAAGGKTFGIPGAVFGGIGGAVIGAENQRNAEAQAAADAALGPTGVTSNTLKDLYAQRDALRAQAGLLKGQDGLWETLTSDVDKQEARLAKIAALQAKINAILKSDANIRPTAKPTTTPTGKGRGIGDNVFAPSGESDRLAAEAQARADAYARLRVEQARANEQQIAADDQLHVALLKGLSGYHDAVVKEIDDELAAKLKAIQEEVDAKVTALGRLKGLSKQERQDDLDAIHATAAAQRSAAESLALLRLRQADYGALQAESRVQGAAQLKQYQDETSQLGLVGGALAEAVFWQERENEAIANGLPKTAAYTQENADLAAKIRESAQAAHEAARAMQDNIAVADEFRSGLTDVFAAGLKGWKAMEQAAANFLQQMAETILKTYVLKPLLEDLFGEQGTPLGGIIGQALGISGPKGPTGKTGDPVHVNVDNLGGGASGNPIQNLINDIVRPDEAQNTSGPSGGGTSLPSTGVGNPDDIEAGFFNSIEQGGKTAAADMSGALDTSGKSLGDILTNAFQKGGDLLSSLFDGIFGKGGILSSLFGGGGGGGNFFTDIFGSLFGGGGGSSLADIPADVIASSGFFAKGGIAGPGGRRKFASGGVSTPSTGGNIFAEKGIEAAVPLPDGRSIPVTLSFPKVLAGPNQPQIIVNQTIHADRSILGDDLMRKIEKSKREAIETGASKGATIALRGQPSRQQNFKRLGT